MVEAPSQKKTQKEGNLMTVAKQGDTVKIHYTGKLDDGTVFDSSRERDPLEFKLGSGMVIAGFDDAVTGMEVGESKAVSIPPEQAYGERSDKNVMEIKRETLPQEITPQVGMKLQASAANGGVMIVTVTDVKDDTLTIDANHQLAGETLNFDIELMEIA
jgi:peptidylprolyl isomerase